MNDAVPGSVSPAKRLSAKETPSASEGEDGALPLPQKSSQQGNKSAWDTLSIFLTRIAARPLSLLIGIISAIYLGPSDKGIAAWITVLALSSANVFGFGCGAATKYFVSKGETDLRRLGLTPFVIGLANGFIAAGVFATLFYFDCLGSINSELPLVWKIAVLVLLPLLTTRMVLWFGLMGESRFTIVNRLELGVSLCNALLLAILVIGLRLGLVGAATAFVASQSLISILTIAIVLRQSDMEWKVDFGAIRKTYSYGIRGWPGSLSKRLNGSLDSLIVGFVAPSAVLGNYSLALTLAQSLLLIPTSINPVLANLNARKSESAAIESVQRIHRIVTFAILLLSLLIGTFGVFLLPKIIPSYESLPIYLVILLCGIVFAASYTMLGAFFLSRGKPTVTSYSHMTAFAVGALTMPILITIYGGAGAAATCSLIYFITFACMLYAFQKNAGSHLVKLFVVRRDDLDWLRNHAGGMARQIGQKLGKANTTRQNPRESETIKN